MGTLHVQLVCRVSCAGPLTVYMNGAPRGIACAECESASVCAANGNRTENGLVRRGDRVEWHDVASIRVFSLVLLVLMWCFSCGDLGEGDVTAL